MYHYLKYYWQVTTNNDIGEYSPYQFTACTRDYKKIQPDRLLHEYELLPQHDMYSDTKCNFKGVKEWINKNVICLDCHEQLLDDQREWFRPTKVWMNNAIRQAWIDIELGVDPTPY